MKSDNLIVAIENEYLKKLQLKNGKYILADKVLAKEFSHYELAKYFYTLGNSKFQLIIDNSQIDQIAKIRKISKDITLIVGGGIDSVETANKYLEAGADYVVMSRHFIKTPKDIPIYINTFGSKLIISIDDTNGKLTNDQNTDSLEFFKLINQYNPAKILIVNDKNKLTRVGIDTKLVEQILSLSPESSLIYSGGVNSQKDIDHLIKLGVNEIVVGTYAYSMQTGPNFSKSNGLLPTIIQDELSGIILMLAYMNEESFDSTANTGFVHFWSRSRAKIWIKGEESGNKLQVKEILLDCDLDTILIKVKLLGSNACHTGEYSCFFNNYKIQKE